MLRRSACGEDRRALCFRPNVALGRRHGQYGGNRLADVDPRRFSGFPAGRISALRIIGRPPKAARFGIELVMQERDTAQLDGRLSLAHLLAVLADLPDFRSADIRFFASLQRASLSVSTSKIIPRTKAAQDAE